MEIFGDKELIEIFQSNLPVNNALMLAILFIMICVFLVEEIRLRTLLASMCVLSLLMPTYFIVYTICFADEKIDIINVYFLIWSTLWFSPTNFILFFMLCRISAIRRLRVWSVVAFLSAFLSWLGTSALIYGLS